VAGVRYKLVHGPGRREHDGAITDDMYGREPRLFAGRQAVSQRKAFHWAAPTQRNPFLDVRQSVHNYLSAVLNRRHAPKCVQLGFRSPKLLITYDIKATQNSV